MLHELRCGECESALLRDQSSGETMEVDMMDVDILSGADMWACTACGKNVCDTCAVRGDGRVCLECATGCKGKRWVGGIGWL